MSIPSPFNTESGLAPRVNALEVVSAEARTAQIEAACSQLFVALFLVLLQRASQVASWVMTLGINEFCQSSYGQQAVNLDAADANVERGDGEIVAWRKTLERISWAWKAARITSAVLIPSSITLFQIERVLRNSAPFVCTSFAFLFALAAFASSCLLAGMMPKLATSHLSDIWIKATQGSVTWKGTSPASVQFWILVELPLCSAAWSTLLTFVAALTLILCDGEAVAFTNSVHVLIGVLIFLLSIFLSALFYVATRLIGPIPE